MKYRVASRRIISKRLGMPGNLFLADLLAVNRMIENAKTSVMPRRWVWNVRYIRTPEVKVWWIVGAYRKQGLY